jgi:hypothetical protein
VPALSCSSVGSCGDGTDEGRNAPALSRVSDGRCVDSGTEGWNAPALSTRATRCAPRPHFVRAAVLASSSFPESAAPFRVHPDGPVPRPALARGADGVRTVTGPTKRRDPSPDVRGSAGRGASARLTTRVDARSRTRATTDSDERRELSAPRATTGGSLHGVGLRKGPRTRQPRRCKHCSEGEQREPERSAQRVAGDESAGASGGLRCGPAFVPDEGASGGLRCGPAFVPDEGASGNLRCGPVVSAVEGQGESAGASGDVPCGRVYSAVEPVDSDLPERAQARLQVPLVAALVELVSH